MYFFDLDGTLLDSNGIWLDIDRDFLAMHGISPVPEDYTEYVTHHSFPDAAAYTRRRFGLDMPEEDICRAWLDMALEAYSHQLPLKPGAAEILARLRAQDAAIGLASSTRRELVECELKSVDLLRYFDQVVTGDQLERSKPAPDIYLLACRALDVAPGEAWAIEDSYNGIRAAAAAGMRAIMVPDLLPPTREMEGLTAAILPDLDAVARYLEEHA